MNKLFIRFNKECQAPLDYEMKTAIRRAVSSALEYEGFGLDTEISFTLTDNEGIKELNSRHRGVDRHTDVLSFPKNNSSMALQ